MLTRSPPSRLEPSAAADTIRAPPRSLLAARVAAHRVRALLAAEGGPLAPRAGRWCPRWTVSGVRRSARVRTRPPRPAPCHDEAPRAARGDVGDPSLSRPASVFSPPARPSRAREVGIHSGRRRSDRGSPAPAAPTRRPPRCRAPTAEPERPDARHAALSTTPPPARGWRAAAEAPAHHPTGSSRCARSAQPPPEDGEQFLHLRHSAPAPLRPRRARPCASPRPGRRHPRRWRRGRGRARPRARKCAACRATAASSRPAHQLVGG